MAQSITNMNQVWMDTNTRNSISMSVSTMGNGASANSSLLVFNVDGDQKFRVDAAGRVRTPYQVKFLATSNNATNITTTSTKLGMYGDVIYNVGGNYSAASCRFTAPIAGYYFFKGQAWQPPGNYIGALSIRINGSQVAEHRSSVNATQYITLNPSIVYYLNAGDYAELYTGPDNNNMHPSTGISFSHFLGYLLG